MKLTRWLGVSLVLVLGAACADVPQDASSPLDVAVLQDVVSGELPVAVTVCKIAYELSPDGSGVDDGTLGQPFTFETFADTGTPVASVDIVAQGLDDSFDPNDCVEVWKRDGVSFDDETEITVTEILPAGFELQEVVFTGSSGTTPPDAIENPTSTSVTFVPQAGMTVFFKNVKGEEPPPSGGEGCTPGYWKQKHHFDSWVGYVPEDNFGSVFGVDRDVTLLKALKSGGGGEKALGRHAVAALLNASAGGVDYAFTTSNVIALVQGAYDTGEFEGVKNLFEGENEKGCPLN